MFTIQTCCTFVTTDTYSTLHQCLQWAWAHTIWCCWLWCQRTLWCWRTFRRIVTVLYRLFFLCSFEDFFKKVKILLSGPSDVLVVALIYHQDMILQRQTNVLNICDINGLTWRWCIYKNHLHFLAKERQLFLRELTNWSALIWIRSSWRITTNLSISSLLDASAPNLDLRMSKLCSKS